MALTLCFKLIFFTLILY